MLFLLSGALTFEFLLVVCRVELRILGGFPFFQLAEGMPSGVSTLQNSQLWVICQHCNYNIWELASQHRVVLRRLIHKFQKTWWWVSYLDQRHEKEDPLASPALFCSWCLLCSWIMVPALIMICIYGLALTDQ